MIRLVAFTGYAQAGKDTAAGPLIAAGFARLCFGDIIRGQLSGLLLEHLAIDPFNCTEGEKERIRPLLEAWGDANYDNIMRGYFEAVDRRLSAATPVVNTRLVRVREASAWRRRGGIIIEIRRTPPATHWERDALCELHARKLIDRVIENNTTVEELHEQIRQVCI